MTNFNEHIDNYSDLVIKVMTNEASDVEMETHHKLLVNNAEYAALFDEYLKTWEKVMHYQNISPIDVDNEWLQLSERLFKKQSNKVIALYQKHRKLIHLAAILAVGLFIGFSYLYYGRPQYTEIAASDRIVERPLPDGSHVTLSYNSSLTFKNNSFNKKQRVIQLSGDAYFDVKHDSLIPFIVETPLINVKVIGTSFLIRTNDINGDIDVIVEEGKVEVWSNSNTNKHLILTKGEKGLFKTSDKELVKTENNEINHLAWKTKKLYFKNTELQAIIYELNLAYNAKIKIVNKELKHCKLTVAFENKELDAALNILREILDIKIKKKGDIIEIRGKSCN